MSFGAVTGKSWDFSYQFLRLIFFGTSIPHIADNATSSPLTNFYVSLHTATPDVSGDQTTNEISYTGYSRVAMVRSGSGWTVAGNIVTPVSPITFGQMSGGAGGIITTWAVGTSSSGYGMVLWFGPTATLNVVNGIIPQLTTLTAITET